MYVFRIVDVIDRSKAWYKGEVFASNISVSVSNPVVYTTNGNDAGDTTEDAGYIYTSLKDNNSDTPRYNYVGYPGEETAWSGKNTWIRSGYANKTKMLTPESGGITESWGAGISGTLQIPTGVAPTGLFTDIDAAVCCLFYGILGSSITINGHTLELISGYSYKNPEITDKATAVTVSSWGYEATQIFNFTIALPGLPAESTYCAGAYQGTWSYIGKTQWTDHKKSINDYSRQEQDEWGNYSLSKRRAGRTYSAEVVLTPRKNAVAGDYDYDLVSLCFSVLQVLRSLLGKPAAFYFNNQDIGCITAPHNTFQNNIPIRLENTDIIVGVLQNFEITDIQGNHAILKMSVNSVPNEYQNYDTSLEDAPTTAPPLPESVAVPMCTDIVFTDMINSVVLSNGDSMSLSLTAQSWINAISLTPTPSDAPIKIVSIEAYSYTTISIQWVPDPLGQGNDTLTVTCEGKGDPAFEWEVADVPDSQVKIIRMRGLTSGIGDKKNFFKVQTARWDTTSNTYGYGEMFYLANVGTTVTE